MTGQAANWLKSLAAVGLGNALYFWLMPDLPSAARHKPMQLDLGIVVDLWFCLCAYGLLEGGVQASRWLRKRKSRMGTGG